MHRNHPPSPAFLIPSVTRYTRPPPLPPSMGSRKRSAGLLLSFQAPPLPNPTSSLVRRSEQKERISMDTIFKYIRKFLHARYSIFDIRRECRLALIFTMMNDRKKERRKKTILVKSHRSIENQVSENLLLSSRATCARILAASRSIFHLVAPTFSPHFSRSSTPPSPPFLSLSLPTVWTVNAAPISLTRIIARKIRNGAAVPRGHAIIFQIRGYPPFLLLFNLSLSLSLFLHPFLSFSPFTFFIHPRKYGRVKRDSPRPSTWPSRVSNFLSSSRFSLPPLFFFFRSLSFYLMISSKSSPLFPLCNIEEGRKEGHRYLEEERVLRDEIIPKIRGEVWQYSRIFLSWFFSSIFSLFFPLIVSSSRNFFIILLFLNIDLIVLDLVFASESDIYLFVLKYEKEI